jgi:hypothetical protein
VGVLSTHGRGRARALVGFGAVAVLLFAACGGGGGSKSSDTTSPANGAATNVTTSTGGGGGGNGQCFQDPGPQKARVRYVNLFTNAAYPSGDIEVRQGFSAKDACGKKLATVKYGEASDYIDVTAGDSSGNWETGAYPVGAIDEDHLIISQTETWKGGEQVTIIVMAQDPSSGNRPSSGGNQVFFEKPVSDINPGINPVPGKGMVVIGAAPVQYVAAKDAAWVAGIAGQTKCLMTVGDTENTRTNIGGTSLVPYLVTPGSISLSLYKSQPGTCTGTADIGPATVDTSDGSRTLVLVYGPDPTHFKLLVLPVAS